MKKSVATQAPARITGWKRLLVIPLLNLLDSTEEDCYRQIYLHFLSTLQ